VKLAEGGLGYVYSTHLHAGFLRLLEFILRQSLVCWISMGWDTHVCIAFMQVVVCHGMAIGWSCEILKLG
jgi:hypothetical protein